MFILLAIVTLGYSLQILPWGITLDPITYIHGNQLFKHTASNCTTEDTKFFLPCGLNIDPIGRTDIDLTTNVYIKTSDYSADGTTVISGKAGGSFFGIGAKGSYSQSHEDINKKSYREDWTYVETMIQMQLYKVFTDSITMPLSDEFIAYMNILSAALTNKDERYNTWITQFAADFPYTYISEVIVGGALYQTQFVDDSFCQVTSQDILKRSAKASCKFGLFSASGSYNYGLTTEQIDAFEAHSYENETIAIGGLYLINMTLQDWQKSVYDQPAVLAYTVSDTKNLIQPELESLSGYPKENIIKIQSDYIAIHLGYFNNNTHVGCPMRNSTDYKVWANVDSGNCTYNITYGSSFGGFYYTKNDNRGSLPGVGNPINNGQESCPFGFFKDCTSNQYLDACFCLTDEERKDGPSFGGGFGSSVNAITNGSTCPSGFNQVSSTLGGQICISDTAPGYIMGGMYISSYVDGTCKTRNPYTKQCTCSANAPWSFNVNLQDRNSYYQFYDQITICYGGPQFSEPSDPGIPIPWQPIGQNTWLDNSNSDNHTILIVIVVATILTVIGIVIMIIVIVYKKYRRAGYLPV